MPPFKATLPFTEVPRGIYLSGQSPLLYRQEDLDQARREGAERVREQMAGEMEALRQASQKELEGLQAGVFQSISDRFNQALGQMRGLLPQLVVEATSRVLGGVEMEERLVRAVVEDLLSEVAPGTEPLEVELAEEDLGKLERGQEQFQKRFPSIRFRANPDLRSGDCLVRTRFGVVDGRLKTKLRGLESLLG
jgi:flagellar assembly protein FliH